MNISKENLVEEISKIILKGHRDSGMGDQVLYKDGIKVEPIDLKIGDIFQICVIIHIDKVIDFKYYTSFTAFNMFSKESIEGKDFEVIENPSINDNLIGFKFKIVGAEADLINIFYYSSIIEKQIEFEDGKILFIYDITNYVYKIYVECEHIATCTLNDLEFIVKNSNTSNKFKFFDDEVIEEEDYSSIVKIAKRILNK